MRTTLMSLLLVAVLAPLAGLVHADVQQVESRVIWTEPDLKAMSGWRAPELPWDQASRLVLAPLAAARIDAVHDANAAPGVKALQIGIAREIHAEPVTTFEPLHWQTHRDGRIAVLEIVSPTAEGLRAGLDLSGYADDTELRVAGSAFPDLIYTITVAQARSQLDADGLYWTAVTDGERQRLEIFHADGGPDGMPVVAVSHLLVGLHGDADLSKAMKNSGACNIDAICRAGTLGQHYVTAKNAVARMIFTSGGSTSTCTGTLLNDTDPNTVRLWFFSAHHCINTQAEANTLSTFWQNETPTCGSNQAGPNVQMTGGADLRHSSAGTDALLLELRGNLPGGIPVAFAGWSSQALAANAQVVAIHHPSGDRKKVSRGVFNRVAGINIPGQVIQSTWRVNWNEGTTEGGSSGSGLFTGDASSFYLRGGLIGGAASCANSGQSDAAGNWDSYSRFDQVYPSIQQFLSPPAGGSNGPTRDYTGQWDAPGEAGRGLSLFQFPAPNHVLFGLWFVYDNQGRASWYQLDPAWTGTNVASGRVVRWTGPAWGPTYNQNNRSFVEVGTFSLSFTSATTANFTYNVDGVNRSITLNKL